MTCEEAQEHIVALLHHELSAKAERDMLRHAGDCAACREELGQTRAITHAIRELVPREPSARERRRLLERILNAAGGSRLERAENSPRALPPAPETRMLPGPRPTKLLGFASPAAFSLRMGEEVSRSVTLHPAAETHAMQPPPARASHRSTDAKHGHLAAWAGLLCWVLLGLLVLAAGLLAAVYAPRARPRQPLPQAASRAQRAAEIRWNERRMAKLNGQYSESFLTGGSVQLREAGETGLIRALPHFVPATGEMCLVLYRQSDMARVRQSAKPGTAELLKALESAPDVPAAAGVAKLPMKLVEKFIGAENRATLLVFDDRIEIWNAMRLEKYLATQPRSGLPGSDTQGVSGLAEP